MAAGSPGYLAGHAAHAGGNLGWCSPRCSSRADWVTATARNGTAARHCHASDDGLDTSRSGLPPVCSLLPLMGQLLQQESCRVVGRLSLPVCAEGAGAHLCQLQASQMTLVGCLVADTTELAGGCAGGRDAAEAPEPVRVDATERSDAEREPIGAEGALMQVQSQTLRSEVV